MKKDIKSSLLLFLLMLLPAQVYGINYGISDGFISFDAKDFDATWNVKYQEEKVKEGFVDSFEGSGTAGDPYLIQTVWDLCRLEDRVNHGESYSGKRFKLVNDLDLDNFVWYPIGVRSDACFAGSFDGNNKTIRNMNILLVDCNVTSPSYSYGLFGYVKGVIRDLNMTDANITINRNSDNKAPSLRIGLLCGYMDGNMSDNVFAAAYRCQVQGRINGSTKSYYQQTYAGGITGIVQNPVSIYKCQADVTMGVNDIVYVGGIAGAVLSPSDIPAARTNGLYTPCQSYIFDCVAHVDIYAQLTNGNELHCGGICGYSGGDLLACAATGTIRSNKFSETPQTVTMDLGGLVGTNAFNIMGCVSAVHLKDGRMVGGLVGENNSNIQGILKGNIVNSIYCGHIDSPDGEQTHGLVGHQITGSNFPLNCYFLGTMHGGTNKAPLWSGTGTANNGENCYCDRNLYDDGESRSCYKYTDEFGSANATWFCNDVAYNVGWHSRATASAQTRSIAIDYYKWSTKSEFYPQVIVDEYNITKTPADEDERLVDYVIRAAADKFGDNSETLKIPTLFQKYAWLASVPMNVPNHDFRADFVDTPVSLAIRQQQLDNEGHQKTASYAIDDDKMTISGETNAQIATPKDNVKGDVMLTVTSDDGVSKQFCLDVYTSHTWDGKVAKAYDGGNGTQSNPYLIHNARQLMKAFTTNASGEYYRLTKDIWFNENLLTDTGEPKDGNIVWNHQSNRETNNWFAHLDGDSHLVHGLYSTNAFGLLEKIHHRASIENVGFVDCLVWSPETDPVNTGTGYIRPFGFFTPVIASTAEVKNCLFDGVVKERRTNTFVNDFGAFIHTIDYTDAPAGDNPVIEDCVLSIVAKSDIADRIPEHAFLSHENQIASKIMARRVLVLNNSMAKSYLTPSGIDFEACHYPEGYLPYYEYNLDNAANARSVADMTNGTFFSGAGYGKWTVKQGSFPMLTSFAATNYGKLISLPVYASSDNRLADINYLIDIYPGAATWQSTDNSVLEVDKDIRVIEPKTVSSTAFVVRSMSGAKMLLPVKTAADITTGIRFSDIETKKFCLAHYDTNGDDAISLRELKDVTLSQFQQDMNKDDGNPSDNDGDLIAQFPEFRYFAGVDGLGTSFQEKDNLQQLAMSGRITELPDDAFRGTSSMTSFTMPVTVTAFGAHPFYNSGLESFEVETDHELYNADDGLLTNKDKTQLLCWPNGKQGFDIDIPAEQTPSSAPSRRSATVAAKGIEIPANLTSLANNAIYKIPEVNSVFLSSADYDYNTVKQPETKAITPANDGTQIRYFVKDGTHDSEGEGATEGEESGEGNGHLLNRYKASPLWTGKSVDRYWELEVNKNSKDSQNRYWSTMYLGFDTQLPAGLTAYIVDKEETQFSSPTLVLRKIGRKVPMLTPVVIVAESPGTYKLFPSKESKYDEIGMSENLLDGVNRNGFNPYQGDANDGGCLTLGRNKSGVIGFYIYKGTTKIPPFRAYISVNKVSDARSLPIAFEEEVATGVKPATLSDDDAAEYYDLKGVRVQNPNNGVFINNGRLVIKR